MKTLKWIWWFGSPLWAMICGSYAIAFAGYGLSFWATKPEPNAGTLVLAFIGAALYAANDAASTMPSADRGGK